MEGADYLVAGTVYPLTNPPRRKGERDNHHPEHRRRDGPSSHRHWRHRRVERGPRHGRRRARCGLYQRDTCSRTTRAARLLPSQRPWIGADRTMAPNDFGNH